MAHFRIAAFDDALAGRYREHMFRYNPLVPSPLWRNASEAAATAGAPGLTPAGCAAPACARVPTADAPSLQAMVDAVRACGAQVCVFDGVPADVAPQTLDVLGTTQARAEFEERLSRGVVASTPRQYT